MKSRSIFAFLLSLPFFGLAQSNTSLGTIFYGLPINDSRLRIKTQIISNDRFLEKPEIDSSFFDTYKNTYLGNIIRHNLSNKFVIDSATIELTWGYGSFRKLKRKGRELTFIIVQYYVHDMAESNALTQEFWNIIKRISSDTADVTVGRKEDNNFSFGKQIKINRRRYLPQISILQQEYNNTVFIVRIEYERFGG